jgi:hypothetical protein
VFEYLKDNTKDANYLKIYLQIQYSSNKKALNIFFGTNEPILKSTFKAGDIAQWLFAQHIWGPGFNPQWHTHKKKPTNHEQNYILLGASGSHL